MGYIFIGIAIVFIIIVLSVIYIIYKRRRNKLVLEYDENDESIFTKSNAAIKKYQKEVKKREEHYG